MCKVCTDGARTWTPLGYDRTSGEAWQDGQLLKFSQSLLDNACPGIVFMFPHVQSNQMCFPCYC
jgi:hypothetical protein